MSSTTTNVDYVKAAGLLEQAVRVGCKEPEASYLLALCYKRQGRNGEARGILAKIADPDANVLLQRGLLAYLEKEYALAEPDFAQAWQKDPQSFAAAYNLLLARLCQGKSELCVAMIGQLLPLAPSAEEQRFLALLKSLLAAGEQLSAEQQYALTAMSDADERRLIDLLTGLGQFDVLFRLLALLVQLRPNSTVAFQAFFGAALRQAKLHVDRCRWDEAASVLQPLLRRTDLDKIDLFSHLALLQMLGVCNCMSQEFEQGLQLFRQAQELFQRAQTQAQGQLPGQVNAQGVYQGAWLEQNLALVHEWQGRLDKAEGHWNRYFDYLEYYFPYSQPPTYLPNLAFEGLNRLADLYGRKDKWNTALGFLQRAHKIRPTDNDILERMFTIYTQLKRPDDAKKILRRLREVRPNDPQVELFELDVRDIRDLDDLERLINDIRRVAQKYPGNLTVEDRASVMIGNLLPFMQKLVDQWTGQINKVMEQMRRLPSYQINWPVVRDVMRDLQENFYNLRKLAQKCISQVHSDEVRKDLTNMMMVCDRKIEQCHSLGD